MKNRRPFKKHGQFEFNQPESAPDPLEWLKIRALIWRNRLGLLNITIRNMERGKYD